MATGDHSGDQGTFPCPACGSSDVFRSDSSTFTCQNCGQDSHEKIARNADTLEELAESDLPVSDIASLLLGREAT